MKVVILARKPLSEGSVVRNVLTHGTGAINIDASRISAPGESVQTNSKSNIAGVSKGIYGDFEGHGCYQTRGQKLGRFPANLILEHLPGCQCLGGVRVGGRGARKSSIGQGREGNHTNGIYGAKQSKVTTAYVDEDGTEMVEAWECEPGCPVADLDAVETSVTGVRTSRSQEASVEGTTWFYDNHKSREYPNEGGGASRYYKQVRGKSDDE